MKLPRIFTVFAIIGFFFFASCDDNICYECNHAIFERLVMCEEDSFSKAQLEAAVLEAELTLDYDCKEK